MPNAPVGVIRILALDDDIEVARPVLKNSSRLDDSDLIAAAGSKGQLHLAAIAQRRTLSEAVTDVLVERGNKYVAHSVRTRGARFSDAGFGCWSSVPPPTRRWRCMSACVATSRVSIF